MNRFISYPKAMMQTCPLCFTEQPILNKGMMKDIQDKNKIVITHDKGYSFCNCENIYFTKWENMDQSIYDDAYVDKYDNENVSKVLKKYSKAYFPVLKKLKPNLKRFIEVGSINDAILEDADHEGWQVVGYDIVKRDSMFPMLYGDIEEGLEWPSQFDCIWMSHVVEHLHNPIQCLELLKDHLVDDGLVFIAMPDPFFIDHANVYSWQHWWVKEHHILWDMGSFIENMEKIGFICEMAERNINSEFICNGDYHLIFRVKS